MSRRSLVLLLLAAALGLRALPVFSQESPASASFLLWSDNSVSALFYGWGFEVDPPEQSTVTLEHAHASRIGDLFMFVDFAKFHDVAGGADDTTWYGEFGPRFSFGKMLGKDLSHTFFKRSRFEFKDVLLAAQYERGEDPDVAEAVLLGVGVDLDVREAGILGGLARFNFLQLNFYARRELTAGADSSFNDAQITMVGSYPFSIGKVPFLIDGYFDWVLGLGSEPWSHHLNPQVLADVGAAAGGASKKFYVGVELDFWWNKFRIPDSAAFETDQQAISVMAKYHF